jgi:two-component system sensor histidine kinase RpfC
MPTLTHIVDRFRNREDSEHQQAFVRVIIGIALSAYLLPKAIEQQNFYFIWFNLITNCSAAFIPIWIYFKPAKSGIRRVFGIATDTITLTLLMFLKGEHWMVFYVLFIWTTSGYGFRFGQQYLVVSFLFSLLGLFVVAFFSNNSSISQNIFFELIIAYACFCFYIHSLVKRLYVALENANLASEAKRQFLSTISHELRSPLHAIAGQTEILRELISTPQEKELTVLIDSSVNQMLHLVNATLDFSKIEAGKIELDYQQFSIDKLIASISHLYIQQAKFKQLDFHTHVSLAVPEYITSDQYRIQQVLTNLISNALKFTTKGCITLRVDTIQNTDGTKFIKWSIRDTGIGIPYSMQTKIFESFTQADASTSRQYGGTGLGTTIAKQLVVLLGGEIGLISQINQGSEFWFTTPYESDPSNLIEKAEFINSPLLVLSFDQDHRDRIMPYCAQINAPLVDSRTAISRALSKENVQVLGLITQTIHGTLPNEAKLAMRLNVPVIATAFDSAEQERTRLTNSNVLAICDNPDDVQRAIRLLHSWPVQNNIPTAHQASIIRKLPKKKVLIADDSLTNLQILSRTLEKDGHEVVEAFDGEDALNKFAEDKFDLIILDFNMPRKNGLEATKMIRILEIGTNMNPIPIVILSADATRETERDALAAGASAYITKPIGPQKLLDRLSKVFIGQDNGASVEDHTGPIYKEEKSTSSKVLDHEIVSQLKELSNDPDFVSNLVLGFITDSGDLLTRVKTALVENDYTEWKESLHAFKGAASALGLKRLQVVLDNAHAMARPMVSAQGQTMLSRIEEEFRLAKIALSEATA